MKLANLRWRNQALPKSHLNLRELLSDTNCARLTEDGKRIQCLYCGSTPKLDKSKRTAEGHLKYFRSVHNCKQVKGLKENMKEISEYFDNSRPEKLPNKRQRIEDGAQNTGKVYSAALFC